jgi:7,8-dihydropterin-6-yl-methyl-4-(beta-D-ribofuranosyl)aminobenzene 5'-phosphate synthase
MPFTFRAVIMGQLSVWHNARTRPTEQEVCMRLQRAAVSFALLLAIVVYPGAATAQTARAVTVTVLSTMLAGNRGAGIGEWGFAAVLEVDGRRLLVDTGERPDTVLRNASELGIDLSDITDLVLTHNHGDHTSGLLTLRRELARKNPRALSRVHVARGIFYPRPGAAGRDENSLLAIKAAYEATGGVFVEHAGPAQLLPNVWFTGPVPRTHPERNWTPRGQVRTPGGLAEDTVPEDASIVVDSSEGLVLVSGCGHAGIVNTVEYARKVIRAAPLHAAIGGFHLFAATDATLEWTAGKLREFGLQHFLGAHCTGIEAVYRIRSLTGLTRRTAVVGAVGSGFTLGKGIDALSIAG